MAKSSTQLLIERLNARNGKTIEREEEKEENKKKKLNLAEKVLAGAKEIQTNLARGILNAGEGVIDAGAMLTSGILNATGNKSASKKASNFAQKNLTDKFIDSKAYGIMSGEGIRYTNTKYGKWLDKVYDAGENNEVLPSIVDNIFLGAGQSLGYAGMTAGLGALGVTGAIGQFAPIGVSAFGSGSTQAVNEGASIGKALGYGALSGGTEMLTEAVVGNVLGKLGIGTDSVGGWNPKATGIANGKGIKAVGKYLLKTMNEEGIEEVISDLVDPLWRKVSVDKDKSLEKIWKDNGGVQGLMEDYIVGALSSLLGGGSEVIGGITDAGGVKHFVAKQDLQTLMEVNNAIEEAQIEGNEKKLEKLNKQKDNVKQDIAKKWGKDIEEIKQKLEEKNEFTAELEKYNALSLEEKEKKGLSKKALQYAKEQGLAEAYKDEMERDIDVSRTKKYIESLDAFKNSNVDVKVGDYVIDEETGKPKLDEDGNPIKMEDSHTYDAEKNTHYFTFKSNSVKYNVDKAKTSLKTIHEVAHGFMDSSDTARENVLKSISKEELQKRIDEKRPLYEKRTGTKVSDKYLKQEVANDLLGEKLFSNMKEFRDVVNSADKKGLTKLLSNIRQAFVGRDKPNGYKEAVKYIQEAVRNTQDTEAKNNPIEKFAHKTEEERKAIVKNKLAETRYSIVEDVYGKKYVELDLDSEEQKRLDNKSPREMKREVKRILEDKYRGKNISDNNSFVTITSTDISKMTNSTYEHKLRILPELKDLLEVSKFIKYENSEHAKFSGFFYFRTNYKILDKAYTGVMNIGISKNDYTIREYELNQIDEIKKDVFGNKSQLEVSDTSSTNKLSQDKKNVKKRFSLDTEGNELTEKQISFFKDSKLRDNNGNLMVLYHQTGEDFTVFDVNKKGAGKSDFLTPFGIFMKPNNKDIGLRGKNQIKLYANVTNPLTFNNREELESYLRKNGFGEYIDSYNNIDNDYQKRFDELDNEWMKHLIARNDVKANIVEKQLDELLAKWHTAGDDISASTKDKVNKFFRESGYDGIVLKEDKGSFGRKVETYIAFNPNQVKLTTNENPTSSEDIRYSLDDIDNDYELTEEENKELNKLMSDFGLDDAMLDDLTEEYDIKDEKRVDYELRLREKEIKRDEYNALSEEEKRFISIKKSYDRDYRKLVETLNRKMSKEVFERNKNTVLKTSFKNGYSQVVPDGKFIIPMFHGTPDSNMYFFDQDKIGRNGIVRGAGYYLIDTISEAERYTRKDGKVICSFVNITNPISDTKKTLDREKLKKLIKFADPEGLDVVGSDGDVASEGYDRVLNRTLDRIYQYSSSDYDIIQEIYAEQREHSFESFHEKVTQLFGYDGYVAFNMSEGTIAVAWKSNQIKDVFNVNPTDDKDIRYSLDEPVKPESLSDYVLEGDTNRYNNESDIIASGLALDLTRQLYASEKITLGVSYERIINKAKLDYVKEPDESKKNEILNNAVTDIFKLIDDDSETGEYTTNDDIRRENEVISSYIKKINFSDKDRTEIKYKYDKLSRNFYSRWSSKSGISLDSAMNELKSRLPQYDTSDNILATDFIVRINDIYEKNLAKLKSQKNSNVVRPSGMVMNYNGAIMKEALKENFEGLTLEQKNDLLIKQLENSFDDLDREKFKEHYEKLLNNSYSRISKLKARLKEAQSKLKSKKEISENKRLLAEISKLESKLETKRKELSNRRTVIAELKSDLYNNDKKLDRSVRVDLDGILGALISKDSFGITDTEYDNFAWYVGNNKFTVEQRKEKAGEYLYELVLDEDLGEPIRMIDEFTDEPYEVTGTYDEVLTEEAKNEMREMIIQYVGSLYDSLDKSRKAKTDERIAKIKERNDEFVKKLKEEKKELRQELWDVKKKFVAIERTNRASKSLNNLLSKKGGGVGQELVDIVKPLVHDTGKASTNKILTKKYRQDIKDFLKTWNEIDSDGNTFRDLSGLPQLSNELLDELNEVNSISDDAKVNTDEIRLYESIIKQLRKYCEDAYGERASEVFDGKKIKDVAEKGITQQKGLKDIKWNALLYTVSPRVVFARFDDFKNDGIMQDIYNKLTVGRYAFETNMIKLNTPFTDFKKSNKAFMKALAKGKITVDINDTSSITLTNGEAFTLYKLLRQSDSFIHIVNSGIEIDNKVYKFANESELNSIKKQIEEEFDLKNKDSAGNKYLELLNKFFKDAGEIKRITDRKTKGTTNIIEGIEYFPIRVSSLSLSKELGGENFLTQAMQGSKNYSWNNKRTGRLGILEIGNVQDIVNTHLRQISMYGAYAQIIQDINQVYNYKFKDGQVEGINAGESFGQLLKNRFGKDKSGTWNTDAYINELLRDVQGIHQSSKTIDSKFNRMFGWLRGKFAQFQLGANLKVMATQLASIPSACKYINPQSFIAGMGLKLSDYPLPDSAIYRNNFNQVTYATTLAESTNAIADVFSKGIKTFDSLAIKMIWKASLIQCKVNEQGISKTVLNERLAQAKELFEKTVRETQPDYSALSRSSLARSENEIVKSFMMFTTQPQQNWSNLVEAVYRCKVEGFTKDNVKDLTRTSASIIAEGLVYTAMAMLFKHFLDRDDKEENFLDYLQSFFNDNILGMIPFLNNLDINFSGKNAGEIFEVQDLSIGWLGQVKDSLDDMLDIFNPDTKYPEKLKDLMYSIGRLTGIPTKNIYNYVSSAGKSNWFGLNEGSDLQEFAYVSDAKWNGLSFNNKTKINEAIKNGNTTKARIYYNEYTNSVMRLDNSTRMIMFDLYRDGYTNVSLKKMPNTITVDGETIAVDKAKFGEIYNRLAGKLNAVTGSYNYRKLTPQQQAKLISDLINAFYNMAKYNQTGEKYNKTMKLLSTNYNSTKALTLLAQISELEATDKKTKKEVVTDFLKKQNLTKEEKYLVWMLAGYSLTDEQKKLVTKHLRMRGLTTKQVADLMA